MQKLFKDISNGMLRRKRGAEFDLSDSDDNMEARRRAKRREFAKMRKALLANENVGKIAEDPKKLAFLRAIEDREDDIDDDFLDQGNDNSQLVPETQPEPEPQNRPSTTDEISGSKRKRPLQESNANGGNRPPPHARRVPTTRKPATLAEIRDSVSFLIEEPDALQEQYPPSSDEEQRNGAGQHHEPFAAATSRKTAPAIDRISLKRAESASLASNSGRLAFHDPAAVSAPGFRVPSLLRRATTQVTGEHGITTAGTERAAGEGRRKTL